MARASASPPLLWHSPRFHSRNPPKLAPTKPLKVPALTYERYTLPNGLTVLLHEDHRLPLVAVDLWYHVGPVNEAQGRTGFAHLFEHMMFQGSKHVGEKAHFRYLEGVGATDINGTTDFDRTNYFETVPSNQLELALWLESDRMGFLLDTLDREEADQPARRGAQRAPPGLENRPYGLVEEEVYHALFPQSIRTTPTSIGSHADIEAARLMDVRNFFRELLRAQQRHPRHRRRLRQGEAEGSWSRSTSARIPRARSRRRSP